MGILFKRVVSCAMVCLIGVASTGMTAINTPITTIIVNADESYKSWRQGDSRWGSMRLGGSGYTMSNSGCAATSLTMLMVHSGSVADSSFTPATLCTFFNNNGGFSNRGDISWSVANKLSSSFSFQGYGTLSSSSSSGKTNEIKSYLDAGYYLIVGVKDGGHWVAVDRVENGVVYIIDPANGQVRNLFEAYSNSGIYKIRKFYGANSVIQTNEVVKEEEKKEQNKVEELPNLSTQKESEEAKTSTSSTYSSGLYNLTSELCFRIDASSSADVIDIIPYDTSLNVLETDGEWGYTCYDGNMGWINLGYSKKVQTSYKYSTGVYTNAEPLNYRASASTSAESYGIIPIGTILEVTEVNNNWGKIYYEGKSAWICLNYASEGETVYSSAVDIAVSNSDNNIGVYVTTDNLCLRKDNSTNSTKLDVIENGTAIDIVAVIDNWGKTIYDGQVGWVCLDYAKYQNKFTRIPCDANGDSLLNIDDIFYVAHKLKTGQSFTESEKAVLDLDNSGGINSADYLLLKYVIVY